MSGKQPHAGKKVQSDPSVKIANHGLHQFFHQITIDLEKRSRAHAKSLFPHLIRKAGIAHRVFRQLASGLSTAAFHEEGDSLDLRRLCLQSRSELAHLWGVWSKVNLKQHLGVGVVGKKFNFIHASRHLASFTDLPDMSKHAIDGRGADWALFYR